jgi:hypothetical protein
MLSALDRQVVATWYQRRRGRVSGSPRLAIVGNCQSPGIAYAARLLLPDAAVDVFMFSPGCLTSIRRLAATLKTYDFVFCSEFGNGIFRDGDYRTLQDRVESLVRFPQIAFAGFHPDIVCIDQAPGERRPVEGPMGAYHSAIVMFAYLAGLLADEAEALFDAEVFGRLGYLDLWEPAQALFLAQARETGIDLAREFLRWTRRGCFMHTINHPKAYVLFDVAKAMLARIGLSGADLDFEDFSVDPLASGPIWPVYAPIAESLGLKGSFLFRTRQSGRHQAMSLSLRRFIHETYRAYGALPRHRLEQPRVRSLLEDADTARMLRDFARAKSSARVV